MARPRTIPSSVQSSIYPIIMDEWTQYVIMQHKPFKGSYINQSTDNQVNDIVYSRKIREIMKRSSD